MKLESFVVCHRIGGVTFPRLWLKDVPPKVRPQQVKGRLEAAGLGVYYSEGGIAWGNHSLIRWPMLSARTAELIDSLPSTARMTWAELVERSEDRGVVRRVSLRLEPALHAEATRAAQRADESLHGWIVGRIVEGLR